MKITTNCNVYKDKTFDVYCGRGQGIKNNPLNCKVLEKGWLGNPVAMNQVCPVCKKVHTESGDTLVCYEVYLQERLKEEPFKEEFKKLEGKKLGCFCKPKPCHTDIMIKYIKLLNE